MILKKQLFLLLLFINIIAEAQNKPNIIFLLADDQAYEAAGFNGNNVIKTPNLDQLANKGIVFDNHYNTTAICMASRAQIMTGMYEYKTGCNFLHGALTRAKFLNSYPILLKNAGYDISFAGKFGFSVREGISTDLDPNEYSDMPVNDFNEWRGGLKQTSFNTGSNFYIKDYKNKYPHATRAYGAWASDYIASRKNNNTPFCMSISFKAPHRPHTPDPFFKNTYSGVTFVKPQNYGRINALHLPEQARSGRQYLSLFETFGYLNNYQNAIRKYYELITGVDYAVGMLIDALETNGLSDNTVIIYTSDNGYNQGAHGFGGKVLPYEEATKAPFIYFDPRHSNMGKNIRVHGLTANIDIAPTILELAGATIPDNVDGKSIIPQINDEDTKIRTFLPVFNFWGAQPTQQMSIETEDFKYTYWNYAGDGMTVAEELYDKINDPFEMNNLASNNSYTATLNTMRTHYDTEMNLLKQNSVNYNGYHNYQFMFDRHLDWEIRKEYVLVYPSEPFLSNELITAKNTPTLSPNPTYDGVIHFQNIQKTNIKTIKVIDLNGKKITEPTLLKNNSININQLKKGVYFIKVNTSKGQFTQKVIRA